MNKVKTIAVVATVICVVLSGSLAGAVYHFSTVVAQREGEIRDLGEANAGLLADAEKMTKEIEEWRRQTRL